MQPRHRRQRLASWLSGSGLLAVLTGWRVLTEEPRQRDWLPVLGYTVLCAGGLLLLLGCCLWFCRKGTSGWVRSNEDV